MNQNYNRKRIRVKITYSLWNTFVLNLGRMLKTRVIHGPKDRVTPFDLRNETHMTDAVLFAY